MQIDFYFFIDNVHTIFGDRMNNTDLARERLEHLKENIDYRFEKKEIGTILLEQYDFLTDPKGHYDELILKEYNLEDLQKVFQQLLTPYLNCQKILVVGLGNASFNADALGPKIVNKMEVIQDRLYLLIPRVKGQSGMESAKLVKAIVDLYHIDLVIVIDALSAIHSDALYHTIQINTMGIAPGSGVGNYTMAINEEYLKCKVLAIGVPCVIKVSHLINEFYHYSEGFFAENMNDKSTLLKVQRQHTYKGKLSHEQNKELFGQVGVLSSDDRYQLIEEIMEPIHKNYIITSKDIDERVEVLSNMISICLMNLFKNGS